MCFVIIEELQSWHIGLKFSTDITPPFASATT